MWNGLMRCPICRDVTTPQALSRHLRRSHTLRETVGYAWHQSRPLTIAFFAIFALAELSLLALAWQLWQDGY